MDRHRQFEIRCGLLLSSFVVVVVVLRCRRRPSSSVVIESMVKLAGLHISDEDLVTTAVLDMFLAENNKMIGRLLSINKTFTVTEPTVCHTVEQEENLFSKEIPERGRERDELVR